LEKRGGVYEREEGTTGTSCIDLGHRLFTLYVDSGVGRSFTSAFKAGREHDNICVYKV